MRNLPIPSALWNPHDYTERENFQGNRGVLTGGVNVKRNAGGAKESSFDLGFTHQRRNSAGPTLSLADTAHY